MPIVFYPSFFKAPLFDIVNLMLLKRLEISGFKSFAKTMTLDFPSAISGIVGPNGSGKSNVADSIRWVLGEQSMKNLRGKRGEDLIFAGTSEVARMGKASVTMFFDNKNKVLPVEFDEVAIGRRVYRDGVNEYLLNGSSARLKDIIEILSKVGLGASQHHIIAQGDADRILYASSTERKSMISEALGLKIFEIKKNEAERKLESTKENIKEIESLRREIQPHLKYLKSQAEKAKSASELKNSLDQISGEYIQRELLSFSHDKDFFQKDKSPLERKAKELEETIKKSESDLKKEEPADSFLVELSRLDASKELISKRRRELERELWKLEGEQKLQTKGAGDSVPRGRIKEILLDLLSDLESAAKLGTMELVRNAIFGTTQKVYNIVESFNGNKNSTSQNQGKELGELRENIKKLEAEENNLSKSKKDIEVSYQERARETHKENILYRERSDELASLRDKIRSFAFEEEKLEMRRKEFELDFGDLITGEKPQGELFAPGERDQMRKKIERMRIRLEEAGGVDEGVLKEYEATEHRDVFLAKELEDLKKAAGSLGEAFLELGEKIEKDFESGISKINKLFGEFFHEIFGGGKAELRILVPKKAPAGNINDIQEGEEDFVGEEEAESGLDIFVDIPRKRIKSLSMLSGGERALVSIALLFAVSTINPPPFLVLDETDAALDEANSHRYGAMLKELGKKTQLIVITHNRETMQAADLLYGVTMGKNGVSELLSIKFEEAEDVLAKKKV